MHLEREKRTQITLYFTILSFKIRFQSPITLHMNHTLGSRRDNTYQFHNKQLASVMQQLY